MKPTGKFWALILLIGSFCPVFLIGQTAEHRLEVDVSASVAKIQLTMYGVFFEDINFAADGGLYAELVKNRSFEFTLPKMGWLQPKSDRHSLNKNSGMATVIKNEDNPANRNFLRVEVNNASGYELDPYVQDALDLIEFANGDVNTTWGKMRSDMGHPEPFNMKYIGIGNEQWGPEYIKRYKVFEKAIKEKYPDIVIISGSGPFPDGEHFEYGMEELTKLGAEIVDEHYYRPPEWFRDNADLVVMTSYAPLMAHAEGWQWTPDLIWFDNLTSYGTANYYVQKMYSNNAGTDLLAITKNGDPVKGQDNLYASAVKDAETGELIVKIVNTAAEKQRISIDIKGAKPGKQAKAWTMATDDMEAVNSFEAPQKISPVESPVSLSRNVLQAEIPSHAFVVYRVKI